MRKIRNHTMGVNLYAEQFDSLTEFNKAMKEAKTSKSFLDAEKTCGLDSRIDDYSFTLTKSFEEAEELMAKGYAEGMQSMLKADGGIKYGTSVPQRKDINNYMGYRPNVPRAIIGLPKSMVQAVKITPKVKMVSLYYDMAARCSIDATALAVGGKNLMALIKHFEAKGCRVEVYMIMSATTGLRNGRTATLTVKSKAFDQKVNPLLMSYPITHPSFFRRHVFRWIETSEATDVSDFVESYGRPTKYSLPIYLNTSMQDFLRKANIIPQNGFYLDCEKVAACNSINEILELLK